MSSEPRTEVVKPEDLRVGDRVRVTWEYKETDTIQTLTGNVTGTFKHHAVKVGRSMAYTNTAAKIERFIPEWYENASVVRVRGVLTFAKIRSDGAVWAKLDGGRFRGYGSYLFTNEGLEEQGVIEVILDKDGRVPEKKVEHASHLLRTEGGTQESMSKPRFAVDPGEPDNLPDEVDDPEEPEIDPVLTRQPNRYTTQPMKREY